MWTLSYRALGHRTLGSGLYIDPISNPVSFAFELFERGTILLAGQLGAPFADAWTRAGPYAQGLLVFWAALSVIVMGKIVWPLISRDPTLKFWALGLVLSLPPACATFPEDRLLFIAGIGAFPLVAAFLASVFAPDGMEHSPRIATSALAGTWLLLHAVAAPLLLPYRSLHMFRYDRAVAEAGDTAFSHVEKPSTQSLILVNGQDFYFTGMMSFIRVARGRTITPRMVTLAGTLEDVSIRRLDERRLLVTPKFGFESRVFDRIYRSREAPFRRMSTVQLGGVDVTVSGSGPMGRADFGHLHVRVAAREPALRVGLLEGRPLRGLRSTEGRHCRRRARLSADTANHERPQFQRRSEEGSGKTRERHVSSLASCPRSI